MSTLLLEIEGMKCGGCVRAVEQQLRAQPGVAAASVNLVSRTAWVDLETPPAEALPALIGALSGLGFVAQPRDQDQGLPTRLRRQQEQGWWQQWRQLVVALALVLISALGHLAMLGLLPWGWLASRLADPWLHALVATAALIGPGRGILVSGARGLWHGLPGMDSLVGVGLASAYGASVVGLLWPASGWPCFFNEPVMLLGFVLSGRFLEERARYRTGWALEQLAQLQPDTAELLVAPGQTRSVRVGGLRPGDLILLAPGDRLPVDAVVRQGSGCVDASALTGEPLPRTAGPGVELAAGSLNLDAVLELEVLRSGADSAVARIMAMVERAQARKAPIQGLADRVAGRFSVAVLVLAAATFLFWWQWGCTLWPQVLAGSGGHGAHGGGVHGVLGQHAATPLALALQLAIAVLVVACPCALGLATPTAITVGTGLAARRGLLFRGGDAIEMASQLRTVLFDKTGTLTLGRPLVSAVRPLGEAPVSVDALLALAAGVEAQSRHPLAHALQQEALQRGLAAVAVSEATAIPGEGVQARVVDGDGSALARVGRLSWLVQQQVPVTAAAQALASELESHGDSVLAVACGSRLLGLVQVADQPRQEAAATIAQLRRQGLGLGLLSGDGRLAVQRLGAQLALAPEELAWELRPEHKLQQLQLRRAAGPVAMVGDGINDAPALAAADLGIAVGTGTQVAQDTADLVILGDRIDAVPQALQLARATMAKVRQNLAWAFGYNALVLPLAAGVLLPGFGLLLTPPLAALLMALSSITVVVNALLLQDGGRVDGQHRGS
ncbi:MAG: cation-translocating P-type ATPase [Cyanobacteriota bacterium]|nr:cation-translocating P-type ATPase [Cyanobacteriota bacterium]